VATVGVSGGDGNPDGAFDVQAGAGILCGGTLTNGVGTCTLDFSSQLPPDNYILTAVYGGNENNGASTGLATLTVTPATTTTSLTLSEPTATFGNEQTEELDVSVTSSAGTPEGTVTIKNNHRAMDALTLSDGTATSTLGPTKLKPGAHTLTATYNRSSSIFGASTSDPTTIAIATEPTTTALKLSTTRVKFGHEQSEKLSVQVKPTFTGPAPAGRVTIKAGSRTLCVISLQKAKGSCRLGASKLRPGTYTLVATYPGKSPYAKSPPARKMLTVTK
jgi:hypothetical protein